MILKTLAKVLGVIALGILIACLLAIPVYFLWNWLMPVIFGLVKITFWQAVGLSVLTSLLFQQNSSSSNS